MPGPLVPEGYDLKEGGAFNSELYTLRAGDEVYVHVYGEENLSDTYKINGGGTLTFPLVGKVEAKGLSVYELKEAITNKLQDGYLKHPDVSIEITKYRPFSVLGAVNVPGSYEYSEGLVMVEAVAVAGGFDQRAQRQKFEVLRRTEDGWERFFTSIEDPVYPGDIIHVGQGGF